MLSVEPLYQVAWHMMLQRTAFVYYISNDDARAACAVIVTML